MKLTATVSGQGDLFEGDRVLLFQALPAGALVSAATFTLEPVAGGGANRFDETIRFTGNSGELWVTKFRVPASGGGDGFVEVDFHARRTLASLSGTGVGTTKLLVDLGGIWVAVNAKGAIKTSPGDSDLPVADGGPLPGLTVARFRLVGPGAPDVTSVTVRSAPSNVTVKVGDLPPFWTRLGEIAQPETSPDFGVDGELPDQAGRHDSPRHAVFRKRWKQTRTDWSASGPRRSSCAWLGGPPASASCSVGYPACRRR